MRLRNLSSLSLIVLAGLTAFSAPPAVADRGALDFRKVLDAANRAYTEGAYLAAVDQCRTAIDLANDALRDALTNALPSPPSGFRALPMAAKPGGETQDPLLGALALSAGRPIERNFESLEGDATIRVAVAPNSPAAHLVQQQLRRAEGDERFEAVIVGALAGVLIHSPQGSTLRFALRDRHLVEVRGRGVDDETMKSVVDERTIARLVEILGR